MRKYILILFSVFAFGQSGLIARQNFAYKAVSTGTNTEIGGVAATISTPALLATKLGISVGNISNFTIVGSDIKCKITGSYVMNAWSNNTAITYFRDTDNLVTNTPLFDNCTALSGLLEFKTPTTNTVSYLVTNSNVDIVSYPNVTSFYTQSFFENTTKKRDYYIPRCTTIGATSGDNSVFFGINSGSVIYVDPSLATNNGGNPDGDLQYAIGRGAMVKYVANFTVPNPVTTLSAGNIYNTAIQLNFTPPSSSNAIDFYRCYANGIFKNKIMESGDYITGLTASISYALTIEAVDIYGNTSLISNSITQSTSNNGWDIADGLISYYKLDSNSNDSFGSNNGTDVSVSYVSGKVSNAGSYNGSTSKTVIGNPSNLQISSGTISCWIKTTSPGSAYRSIFGKTNAFNMFLVDGVFGIYSWAGTTGFKSSTMDLRDGNWHHIAFVFESGTSLNYLYVDGVLKLTTSMTISSQISNFEIGESTGNNQKINALIDEGSVYSTKLTITQIQAIYNAGTGITL